MSMFVRASLVAVMSLTIYSMANSASLAEKPKLEGQHQIIAGERDGKALAEADIKGTTFRFTGDKVVGATKDGTEFLAADYNLDDSKTPCVIVMKLTAGTDKGKELKGLVERNGRHDPHHLRGPGRRGSRGVQDQAEPGDVHVEGRREIDSTVSFEPRSSGRACTRFCPRGPRLNASSYQVPGAFSIRARTSVSGIRSCFSVSRSRMVTVSSFIVSPSMVMQNGVPASSCRR